MIDILIQYKYLLIIPLAIAEGPILSIVCGFFIRLGDLSIIPTYMSLMAGDLIGDAMWYSVGYFFGHKFVRRFGKYFNITEQDIERVKVVFHKYKNSILFISKVTMGLGFALVTLITSGISKIPFGRFMAVSALGQVIWTGLLLSIGFFFGHVYAEADTVLTKISALGIIGVLFACLVGVAQFLRKRAQKKVIS